MGDIIKGVVTGYAQYHNIKNGRTGHLFQNRFKSETVETDKYFLTVLRYINQNPIKVRLVQDMKHYKRSSCHKYFNKNESIINTESIQTYFKSIKEFGIFMEEKNNDECLDYNPTKKWMYDKPAEYINQILNITEIHSLE